MFRVVRVNRPAIGSDAADQASASNPSRATWPTISFQKAEAGPPVGRRAFSGVLRRSRLSESQRSILTGICNVA